jgi:hypothetical protein
MLRTPPLSRTRTTKKNKRVVKKNRKDTTKRANDKWVQVCAKLQEADVARKREIKTIADFKKKVLPTYTFQYKVMLKIESLHSGTQTIQSSPPSTYAKKEVLYETPPISPRSDLTTFPSTSPPVTSYMRHRHNPA